MVSNEIEGIFANQRLPYKTEECSDQWVSDALGSKLNCLDFSLPHILAKHPVLISAPTGRGKSTFALKTLSNLAKQYHGSILVLSNRIALNLQQKVEWAKLSDIPPFGSSVLSDLILFGNIFLMTYHKSLSVLPYLDNYIKQHHLPHIKCIVLDEAHFFCSDATYNPWTSWILNSIFTFFGSAFRIYMTATPDDVKPLIANAEYTFLCNYLDHTSGPHSPTDQKNREQILSRSIHEYRFRPSYNHLTLHFFSDWNSIISLIHEGLHDKESPYTGKWLIFVGSKEDGRAIKKELGSEIADFIDANSKESHPEKLHALSRREKFSHKVLICTSVLDSGFNIKDSEVHHIVIDTISKTQMIQMLGRKRVSDGERVHLYARRKTEEEIRTIKHSSESLYHALKSYSQNPIGYMQQNWGALSDAFQRLLAVRPAAFPSTILVPNTHAEYQLGLIIGRCEQLLDRIEEDGDIAFAKDVCSWFDCTYSPEMDIDADIFNKGKLQFTELFGPYLDCSPLDSSLLSELNQKLLDLRKMVHDKNLQSIIRPDSGRANANINGVLKYYKLPYKIRKSKNSWKINEINTQ